MKKIIKCLILIAIMFIISNSSVNAEDDNGYIVRMNTEIAFLSNNTDLIPIGNGLYKVTSQSVLDTLIDEKLISTHFPDYEFTLFNINYPQITSDTYFEQQWYLNKIDAEAAREKGVYGENVKIAVIDSGLNYNIDLDKNNILQGYNCIVGAEDTNDFSDNIGHGTMVAGLIVAQSDNEFAISGIASNAKIIPIKITDSNSLSLSNIFMGLRKAIDTDCDIINMSFGGPIADKEALEELKTLVDEANEKGIIIVAAVGNSGHTDNVMNYPAGFDNVIGVGSVGEDLTASYFSQKNKSVFITAPGNNIISLSGENSVATGLGTSLSTPIVASAIAIIKGLNPNYNLEDIKNILIETSVDAGTQGYDINYGYGILNLKNILNKIDEHIPKFVISQGKENSKIKIHVHNNSKGDAKADIYLASYKEKRLDEIDVRDNITLNPGVTNIPFDTDKIFEYLFLWDDNLRPYCKKYLIR